jgi:membrane protein
VFGLDSRGARDRLRFTLAGPGGGLDCPQRLDGARAARQLAGLVLGGNVAAWIGFWWFAMWSLLASRRSWRRLYPCAVTTGAFWMGMLAVFSAIFSGVVISYDQKYGPIAIVFGLMSFFIAIEVVLILGAAVGLMWQDRGLSWAAALRKLRRASRPPPPTRHPPGQVKARFPSGD